MNTPTRVAKLFHNAYFGGNWTDSNLKDQLSNVNWEEATKKIYGLNTIATLVYHINYYVIAVSNVLAGGQLDAKDKYSFDHPPIHNETDWQNFLSRVWNDGEMFSTLISKMPEEKMMGDFIDNNYGTYYRNIHGVIEHLHYHLGQIVVLKKILKAKSDQ